ncbi:hypothetical protein [Streptomyces sp. G-G2]|uniref:hypothetical protein n=1 Tax=Streptomyces sp. G-G2 TaxID=3046201 RepID=UPI0024B87D75|nr:hypothetical protein [Streptomyces sp. G-G2]MDJ0385858.1 hypothetical protein [Streptomyces sp. G-G2]
MKTMADMYDLNAIRDSFFASQSKTATGTQEVYVDREGKVRLGTGGENDAPLSRVPQSTFAAMSATNTARLERERRVVEAKFPADTYYESTPGAEGWVYTITTTFENTYEMCARFDGVEYQVRLLKPDLETLPSHDQHGFHLYHSGVICLSERPGSGQPTLQEAYARSATWALGVDFVRMGRPFPFNREQ